MFRDSYPVIPEVRKIAVLRANLLGDFVFTLPALEALKQTHPEAEITLLGKPWHAEYLSHRLGPVDHVVVIPRVRGLGEPLDCVENADELERFFARMNEERFDLAIQLHGGGLHSNPFVRRLGARVTVGLKTKDAIALDRSLPYVYHQHEILRLLEAVALAGAKARIIEPRIHVTERDLKELEEKLKLPDAPLVVLQPGATDLRRCWPPSSFAAVGDALIEKGACVAINGTALERPIVEAVMGEMKHKALDASGLLSLCGLTGLLSRACLVVSNDTGPLHLAQAVGTATVGIYWFTNLLLAGSFTRARHRHVLSTRIHCPMCGKVNVNERCKHQDSFVADVTVEEVAALAIELFESERHRKR